MKDKIFSLTYIDAEVLKRETEFPNLDVVDLAITLFKRNNSLNSLCYAIRASFATLYYCPCSLLQAEADLAEHRYLSSVLNYLSFVVYQIKQPPVGWESVYREERTCWLDLYERKNKSHRIEILQEFRKECLIAGQAARLPSAPITVTKLQEPCCLVVRAEAMIPIPDSSATLAYAQTAIPNNTLCNTSHSEQLINFVTEDTVEQVKDILNTQIRSYVGLIVEKGATKETGWPAVSADGRYLQLC